MPRSKIHPLAVPASFPSVFVPMAGAIAREPFSSREWIFEPKWDGFRAVCYFNEGRARFLSRRRKSLDSRFPELQRIPELIKANSAVLDGEIVALDKNAIPSFRGLLAGRRTSQPCAVVFYAFDLLYLDGHDFTQCPLVARKTALKHILPKSNTDRIRYTEHILGTGQRLFSALEELQLEGMVAKRRDSVYTFGRSRDWVKIKTSAGREEMRRRHEAFLNGQGKS